MRDIKELKEKEAICCKTKKEGRAISDLFKSNGSYYWWGGYNINNIFILTETSFITRSSSFCEDMKNHTIIPASEFLPKDFYDKKGGSSIVSFQPDLDVSTENWVENLGVGADIKPNKVPDLEKRIEALEKHNIEQIDKKVFDAGVTDEDGKIIKPPFKGITTKHMDELINEYGNTPTDKPEALTVEGIVEEYNKNSGEYWMNAQVPKMNALGKLLIIADEVNEGWEWEVEEKHFTIIIEKGEVAYQDLSTLNFSPIKINPDKWDKFISIKGIEQLIKDYLL